MTVILSSSFDNTSSICASKIDLDSASSSILAYRSASSLTAVGPQKPSDPIKTNLSFAQIN